MNDPTPQRWRPALADALMLTAHDSVTGRRRVPAACLNVGLAAALIAELVRGGKLRLADGKVYVAAPDPPRDLQLHAVYDSIAAAATATGHAETIRHWLTAFGPGTRELVLQRLQRARQVEPVDVRTGLLRARVVTVHRVIDPNVGDWPLLHLQGLLAGRHPLDEGVATLAGLVDAIGLQRRLTQGLTGGAHRAARQCYEQSQDRLHPSLRSLVAEAKAAVGGVVTRRHA